MSTSSEHASERAIPAVDRKSASESPLTLDLLARRSSGELGDLYAHGAVPKSLATLDGNLVGRMLAVVRLDHGAPLRAIASFAGNARFPWGGKSFRSDDAAHGKGINRLNLGRSFGRHRVFPFATHFGPSVLDGRPAIILDYDLTENPPVIRAIHDEVREVAPRLFLGPACMKRAGAQPVLVLWFALDAGG